MRLQACTVALCRQLIETHGWPQAQARIQPALSALDLSARERAQHLRVPICELPPEEETTLGSSLVSSLRSFLRQVSSVGGMSPHKSLS